MEVASVSPLATSEPNTQPSESSSNGIDLSGAKPSFWSRFAVVGAILVFLVLTIGLRTVALDSDPYGALDWSAGQLTDEGFYIHNARNVVLYGRPVTDEFNNMLLAPLLHFTQVAIFKTFGVGAIQARSISVVCSLLAIPLLWFALRRTFGTRVAAVGTVLLALDHTNLLFNRMALMDTPAALGAVAAFFAFTQGLHSTDKRRRMAWLAACGILIGTTVTNRTLCAYLLPVPFFALWQLPTRKKDIVALSLGLVAAFAIYIPVWFLPHHKELTHMSQFYRTAQLQPPTFSALADNLVHAVLGDRRGSTPYLFRHAPAQLILVLCSMSAIALAWFRSRKSRKNEPAQDVVADPSALIQKASHVYLVAWLVLGWALLAIVSYAPSRYYVATYPAFMAMAAIALFRLKDIASELSATTRSARLVRGTLVWLLSFHLIETVVHRHGVLPGNQTLIMLFVLPFVPAFMATNWRGRTAESEPKRSVGFNLRTVQMAAAAFACLWVVINGAWLTDWARGIDFQQRDASRWLAQNLPADSVLVGDPAPGLCLDNAMMAVPVFPGLANYKKPIERLKGRPRYITFVVDSPLRFRYWRQKYAKQLTDDHLVAELPAVRWNIAVYEVDPKPREGTRASFKPDNQSKVSATDEDDSI